MKRIMNSKLALEKAMAYCSKMERCKYDMQKKFYNWGIGTDISDGLIDTLVKEDFINEERFLSAYVRGKFLYNKWGRVKLKYSLKLKNFSDDQIDNAFDSYINEDEYQKLVQEQIEKRNKSIDIKSKYERKAKLIRFAQGRGYETELALQCVDNLSVKKGRKI